MNTIESFNKIKEEYENGLSNFGGAMLLVDRENNIIFVNQEAKLILSDDNTNLLIGKKLTSIIEATSSGEVESTAIEENTRPSSEAMMYAKIKTQIFYIEPTYTPEKILVTSTAIPLILRGEVAGAIVIFKKIQ